MIFANRNSENGKRKREYEFYFGKNAFKVCIYPVKYAEVTFLSIDQTKLAIEQEYSMQNRMKVLNILVLFRQFCSITIIILNFT